ncbi:MAG: hypothetical protein ACE5LU_27650 [Anaerolineae bacterium]
MPVIDFEAIRDLKPPAFKLYVYFLDQFQTYHRPTLTIPLADLGYESGLQTPHPYRALRQGKDGTLRRALEELIQKGFLEKTGCRGRHPNTYRLLRTPRSGSQKHAKEPLSPATRCAKLDVP